MGSLELELEPEEPPESPGSCVVVGLVGVGAGADAEGDAVAPDGLPVVAALVPELPGRAWATTAESTPTRPTVPATNQRVSRETRCRPTSRSLVPNRMGHTFPDGG